MFYEVVEITETAWGEDEVIRGRFATEVEAEEYIGDTYGEDAEGVYIQDAWGEVVWG